MRNPEELKQGPPPPASTLGSLRSFLILVQDILDQVEIQDTEGIVEEDIPDQDLETETAEEMIEEEVIVDQRETINQTLEEKKVDLEGFFTN